MDNEAWVNKLSTSRVNRVKNAHVTLIQERGTEEQFLFQLPVVINEMVCHVMAFFSSPTQVRHNQKRARGKERVKGAHLKAQRIAQTCSWWPWPDHISDVDLYKDWG